MIRISLLGCGWLGFPLAKSLLGKGFIVKGSTTSIEKISVLKAAGISPFLISLGGNEMASEMDSFLQNSEILIIAIPPKLRSEASENFVSKIQSLLPFIENSSVKKVLFVSSTSVYADDNSTITEGDVFAACRAKIPFAKCPKVVVFGTEVPVTVTGKYQRLKLRDLFTAHRQTQFRR